MNIRIIARLDIKGPNLVKGIHLEGLRVLGKPERFARAYSEEGADELLYMDTVASLYGRNSLTEIIARTSREIFIPLTVGGGLRTLDDIRTVLNAGADKVAINTGAIGRPEFVQEAARRFGSSTIVVSVEVMKGRDGRLQAYTDNGRTRTGVDAYEWAVRAVELGAGELMITSIDREGTGTGFDLELTRRISESVPVPVIACGGAGRPDHVAECVTAGKADAVAIASILHYDVIRSHRYEDAEFAAEGNTDYLKGGEASARIMPTTVKEIKAHLAEQGIPCRPVEERAHA